MCNCDLTTENSQKTKDIKYKINEFEEEYDCITNEENKEDTNVINKVVFDNFFKECLGTTLLYLIANILISILLLLITSYILTKEFPIITNYKDICNVFLFFAIPISLVVCMVSLIIDYFMHNFLSFLFMFICSTIFLYFVGCGIKRITDEFLAEIFFSIIAINLAFLYLINNFTSIRLFSLCCIMLLVFVL